MKNCIAFRIVSAPEDADLIDALADKALKPFDKIGDEPVLGFSSSYPGNSDFSRETCFFGDLPRFFLVSAARKISPTLLKAECAKREAAAVRVASSEGVGSGYLSRKRRIEIKEEAKKELSRSAQVALSAVPITFNREAELLFVGTASHSSADAVATELLGLGFQLIPWSPSVDFVFAADEELLPLDINGREYHPHGPLGPLSDMLTIAWWLSEQQRAEFTYNDMSIAFGIDGPLLLSGEHDGSGEVRATLRDGVPTGSNEAHAALVDGKKLCSCRLMLAPPDKPFHLTLDSKKHALMRVKLPDGERLDAAGRFSEEVEALTLLVHLVDGLGKYIAEQLDEDTAGAIASWIQERHGG